MNFEMKEIIFFPSLMSEPAEGSNEKTYTSF